MNFSLLAVAFIVFFVSHGIADYWVQTDWQAQNKTKNPVALWRHVGTYTLTHLPGLLFLAYFSPEVKLWQVPIALLAIALPHAALDNRKLIGWFCEVTKGWRRDNKVISMGATTPYDLAIAVPGLDGEPVITGYLRDLNPWEIAVRFHVTIALDQKAHFLCLLLVAIWLAV